MSVGLDFQKKYIRNVLKLIEIYMLSGDTLASMKK